MSAPVASPPPRLAEEAAPPLRRHGFVASPLFPRLLLSRLTGLAARIPIPHFLREAIYFSYARRYGANLRESEFPADFYRSFAEFFCRRLAPNARVFDAGSSAVLSPADGTVVQAGTIEGETFVQAKGQHYPLADLLGASDLSERFAEGSFVSIYLAPGEYHRFHMPVTGRVVEAVRVTGTLLPVDAGWVCGTPRLLARNARLVTLFETEIGPVALVAIGALNVGSIRVLYDGSRHLRRGRAVLRKRYVDGRAFRRGDEVGRFEMGSSLVVLFPRGVVRLEPLRPGSRIRVGVRIGTTAR